MVVGSQIGSYRIERILAEGGMGVVYVGADLRLGRRAAVKQLLPELSGQRHVVERFFNEAKAAANINHPGIVEIYEVGWHTDGSAYFAMKLLEGDSLAKRLRGGPMPMTTACTIARQIASALAAAHAAGIVHRDLKPDNIILVRDEEVALGERPIVLDFGIAKLTGDWRMSHKTRTHTVMGTPWYMSPEQYRGAGEVDHRTDVYATGCLLFEMLTGRPPFVGDGAGEVLGMHQFVQPPTVRSLRREVPPELEAIVTRCLAKQPDQRYQTMAELITTLQACLLRLGAQDSAAIGAPPGGRAGSPAPPLPGSMTVAPLPSTLTGGRGEIATRQSLARKRGLVLGVVVVVAASAIAVLSVVSSPDEPKSEILAAAPGSAASTPDATLAVATPNTPPTTPAPIAPVPTAPVPAVTTPTVTAPDAPAPTTPAPIAPVPTAQVPAATTPTATVPGASATDPPQATKVAPRKESLPRDATSPAPPAARTEPPPPKETKAPEAEAGWGGCDEVSCVLNSYEGACCAKFRKGGGASKPSSGGTAASAPKAGGSDLPEDLDRAMISDGVGKIKPRIMSCGEKSSAKGQVKVSVKVGPDGHVVNVTVKNTPDAALGNCVAGIMQKATFARTRNGGSFAYPFPF